MTWAEGMKVDRNLLDAVRGAAEALPTDYVHQQGWVLTAFRNALWHLLHAPNLEEAVVDTVMRGGDTGTNAAICGALLGAVYGRNAVPGQWVESVLKCRPSAEERRCAIPGPSVSGLWTHWSLRSDYSCSISGICRQTRRPNIDNDWEGGIRLCRG
jgi:ADP-ribosyl-[dinitrogen reductase] hydrolase